MKGTCSVGSWCEQSCPAHKGTIWELAYANTGFGYPFFLPLNSYINEAERGRQVSTSWSYVTQEGACCHWRSLGANKADRSLIIRRDDNLLGYRKKKK